MAAIRASLGAILLLTFAHPGLSQVVPAKLRHAGAVRALVFSPDGKTLASAGLTPEVLLGTETGTAVQLWEPGSGKKLRTLGAANGGAYVVAFTPPIPPFQRGGDGRSAPPLIAAGGLDNIIYLWDAAGKEHAQLKGHDKVVSCVAFAPDGKTLASGSQDNTIRIWDLGAGREIAQYKEPDALNALAFSPDGKTLASAGWFHTIQLWDLTSGKTMRQCVGHQGPVVALAFAPDGRTLASGSLDRSVRIWEVLSGSEIRQIDEHTEQVNAVAFTPPFQREGEGGSGAPLLATGSGDRTVRLWEIASGKEVRRFDEHQGPVFAVALSPDGKHLASASSDNLVLVRDISELRSLKTQEVKLTPRQLETMWTSLASGNPRQAYRAIWGLNAAPQQALPLFHERLAPFAATAERQRVSQLLAELNDEQFAVREKASQELEKLGEIAEPILGKALMGFLPSLEVRRRMERILEKIKQNKGGPTSEVVRALRAISILEGIGTPEARQLLDRFAQGMHDAPLTQEAKSALERLGRRTP